MPPTLRRTLGGRVRDADRNALAVLADHARSRTRLHCIWILVHARDPDSDHPIDQVARSCARGSEPIPDAAATRAAIRAAGERGRFARRLTTTEQGLHAVTRDAGEGLATSVVGHAARGGRPLPHAETALIELADVAARLLAKESAAGAPEPGAPPAAAEEAQQSRAAATTPSARREAPESSRRQAPRNVAYGGGLAEALALLEKPPIHPESRARLARAIEAKHVSLGDAIRTVETDIGLALAVTRAANRLPSRPRQGIVSVPQAIEALGTPAVLKLALGLPVLHPLGPSDRLGAALIRMAPHAVATRVAADLLGRHVGHSARDEPRLIAALHDIGKVALSAASPDYLDTLTNASASPEERLLRERRKLGIDHAALGALAAQRLGLPKAVATAIEQHHLPDAPGPAAIVRLADMLAHEAHGEAVDPAVLAAAGRCFGLDPDELQRLAYDVARSSEPRDVGIEPSPLTPMQHKVLRGLGRSLTYKQIAAELSLSDSTVRSHVHRVYEKLEVADRAQAVLLATERGWI